MMSYTVEYVSGHLFVGGFRGVLSSDNYFRCYESSCPSCPFSLLMDVEEVSQKRVAVSCVRAVVPVHFHQQTTRTKIQIKREILNRLKFIKEHPDHPRAQQIRDEHQSWNDEAGKVQSDTNGI